MSDGTDKTTLSARLNSMLGKYTKAIVVVFGVVVVAIIASVIVFNVTQRRTERATIAAEEIQRLYAEWRVENDSAGDDDDAENAEATALETELREQIASTIESFPRGYSATRANYVLAQLEWDLGNFELAHAAYLAVADGDATSYLAPIALFNAAAALEESGDADGAVDLYLRVVGSEVPNVEAPRALFALGRLAEAAGDTAGALEYYTRLVDEHGGSNWTNLGRNRIIWLNSQEG